MQSLDRSKLRMGSRQKVENKPFRNVKYRRQEL